jgi:hypothetical protein
LPVICEGRYATNMLKALHDNIISLTGYVWAQHIILGVTEG